MKQNYLLLFLLGCISTASAQIFTDGGIDYNITSNTVPRTVEVSNNEYFFGNANIPATVNDGTHDYEVTSISASAFANNIYVTSITIPNTVTNIGDTAFASCSNLVAVTLGDAITTIGAYAFNSCTSLTTLVIPNSVTTMGNGLFYGCSGLTSVTLSNSINTINNNLFYNCSGLASITIPSSVTSIGNSAFYSCTSLTSLSLPDSVVSIGNFSFALCTGFTTIVLPNSITTIGGSAFESCSGLTSVTIPGSVTSIADFAFYNCTNLNTVNCYVASPLTINSNVFGNITLSSCTLNVPVGAGGAYGVANVWKDFNPINPTLSSTIFNIAENVNLFPNPASNNLSVVVNKLTNVSLRVYDSNGRMMMNQKLPEISNKIDTSYLQSGIYLFAIESQEGVTIQKVVKK